MSLRPGAKAIYTPKRRGEKRGEVTVIRILPGDLIAEVEQVFDYGYRREAIRYHVEVADLVASEEEKGK